MIIFFCICLLPETNRAKIELMVRIDILAGRSVFSVLVDFRRSMAPEKLFVRRFVQVTVAVVSDFFFVKVNFHKFTKNDVLTVLTAKIA